MMAIDKQSVILAWRRRALASPSIERTLTGAGVSLVSSALHSAQIRALDATTVWLAGKNLADVNSTTASGAVATDLPTGSALSASAYITGVAGGWVRIRIQFTYNGATESINGNAINAGAEGWSFASGQIPAGATNVRASIQRQTITEAFSADQIQVEIGTECTWFEPYRFRQSNSPVPDRVMLVPGGNSVWVDSGTLILTYRRFAWQED